MAQRRVSQLIMIALLMLSAPVFAQAQTTATSVQLTWTAPGDDGSIGTASQYDLRYSTATITSANFASATRWVSTPPPSAPGTSQTTTVTGLNPSTTYFFALKTADDVGNLSVISNVVSKTTLAVPDIIAPSPIAVNVGTVTDTTAVLDWTSSGDDTTSGTAASYDIRYSTAPITLGNWSSASTVTGEPAPAAAGTAQSFTVRGLTRETAYYFAIRATDESANQSGLSNVPSATTTDTMPPAAILNLTANFMWMAWHSASAVTPRMVVVR